MLVSGELRVTANGVTRNSDSDLVSKVRNYVIIATTGSSLMCS